MKVSKKPRVCMVVNSFPQLSETFIVSKFLGLVAKGWDVHVVGTPGGPDAWSQFPEILSTPATRKRIHLRKLPKLRILAAARLPFALIICLARNPARTLHYLRTGWAENKWRVLIDFLLDSEVLALAPDLVHFEFGTLAASRMRIKRRGGCDRAVVSFRGYDLNQIGLDNPTYYAEVWKLADGVHVLGEDLWQRAQRRGCPADKPHALIPPAIDTGFFDPGERRHTEMAGTEERPLRILSVGRLDWKKGYEHGLKTIQLLRDRGIHLEYHIVGGGSALTAVAFARRQLGLEDCVSLLGPLSRNAVKEEMLWADVFLHSAVSEGFCNSVIEAQAMRLPVVTSNAGGLAENVQDVVTGFIYPRRNPIKAVNRLFKLLRPNLRQEMGVAGRERIINNFSISEQIEVFAEFYNMVLRS